MWSIDTTLWSSTLTPCGQCDTDWKLPIKCWVENILFKALTFGTLQLWLLLGNARSWICVHITIQMLQSPERGFLLKQNTSRVHVMYLTLLTCWFISKSLSSGCKERDQVANKHCSQLQTTHLQHMYKQSFSKHCSMEWTEKADSGLSEEVLKRLFWNLTSRLDFSYGALPWSLAIRPELARLLSSDNAHLSRSISSILSLELSSPNPTVTLHIINPTLLSLALLSKIQDSKILQQQKMITIYWHPHINQKKVTAGFAA